MSNKADGEGQVLFVMQQEAGGSGYFAVEAQIVFGVTGTAYWTSDTRHGFISFRSLKCNPSRKVIRQLCALVCPPCVCF